MLVFPNAKINIGLNVIEKRSDGFHNIESCFLPVPWYDALEVVEADKVEFNQTGLAIPGEGNICLEAYNLLNSDYNLPPVKIHLHKNIPIGAGLGGGSADGAFMLKLLNDKFSLALNHLQLQKYANNLGSDCPFFIGNRPRYVERTGNAFSDIKLNLTGLHIAIIYPEIHISTQEAYSNLVPTKPNISLKKILENEPVSNWHEVKNDFEQNAGTAIHAIKEMLYTKGALYASMTGSGSAVYGLFNKQPKLDTTNPNIAAKL